MGEGKNAAEGDALRHLVQAKARALADESVRSGGDVAEEKLVRLARLARLAELLNDANPPPARRRWPIAVAFVVTLAIASVLLFARVSRTELRVDLVLSEVAFVLASPQVLANAVSLSALGMSGLERLELPDAAGQQPITASAVRLVSGVSGGRIGTLDVGTVVLPAGTRVGLAYAGAPKQFRLSLTPPPGERLSLQADVHGPVQITVPPARAQTIDFATPKAAHFDSGDQDLDLDLTFAAVPSDPFSPNLRIKRLSCARVETFAEPERTLSRRVSTIESGVLYFESLNGQRLDLRSGEWIELAESLGEIRRLELRDTAIEVSFSGDVSGLRGGSEAGPRDLMPSYLQSLKENHALSLLWGTTGYLLALTLSLLRWWKGNP